MPIIEVEHLTKEYRLGTMQSLRQTLLNAGARLTGKAVPERPLFRALDDVNFTIEQGEVVGIIGYNGAGKSTLLKMLAKISTPTHGSVMVNGRIAPLIEVGAGFVPDFTGRENVYLNGAILGLSRQEINKKFDEIVDFAEMSEFIDTPVKRYSSGMQVKLAFAVATSIEAEILIVDEVLAVGDLAFQRKCFDRMENLIANQGRTVLIVGHNVRQLERICSRMMILNKGQITMDGEPTSVANAYYQTTQSKINQQHSPTAASAERIVPYESTGELEVAQIMLFSGDISDPVTDVELGMALRIGIRFRVNETIRSVQLTVGAHTTDFLFVTKSSSGTTGLYHDFEPGEQYVECILDNLPLAPGSYGIGLAFSNKQRRYLWYGDNLKTFQVVANHVDMTRLPPATLVYLPFEWHFEGSKTPVRSDLPSLDGNPESAASQGSLHRVHSK